MALFRCGSGGSSGGGATWSDVLWSKNTTATNSSGTAYFPASSISLDLSQYDTVAIVTVGRVYNSSAVNTPEKVFNAGRFVVNYLKVGSNNLITAQRSTDDSTSYNGGTRTCQVSATGITFGAPAGAGDGANPYLIYGIKNFEIPEALSGQGRSRT